MSGIETIPAQLVQALHEHSEKPALLDREITLTYGQLADFITRLQTYLTSDGPVAVYGRPSAVFAAAATTCVVSGRPFVHLDPAMPTEVLANIILELGIGVVLLSEPPQQGQLPPACVCVDVQTVLASSQDQPKRPLAPAPVLPDDIIYIVATSGTTGKPKCIPVTHQAACLSYDWRDAYTPYDPSKTVGVYIFAIWEMFRPLRGGAVVCFPEFGELMNPRALLKFWQRHTVTEMLFTPSAFEKTLQALPASALQNLPVQRIILNGEVVSDELVAAMHEKLPHVAVWNLYSICETHDIAMTPVSSHRESAGAVGVPMPYLKAVVLDDHDQPCPPGQPGLLHFEGSRMLGPGYINRPEETALRFRDLAVAGQQMRLYDTGDQGFVDRAGAVHVMGRVAHMLKLRGHSIQTQGLTASLHGFIGFTQSVPWIQEVDGQGKVLVLYYLADEMQMAQNQRDWGLTPGQMRMPPALSKALRAELPSYCIPSYLVQLDEMPINAVSGKCDFKRLPKIKATSANTTPATASLPTLALSAEAMGRGVADIDPSLSFHDQGGDSLMAVNLLLALEATYGRRVDFDFALNVPLGRLHDILTNTTIAPHDSAVFDRKGILLTGATGFLGRRVLAAAAQHLPVDEVIYCVIREKRRTPLKRLMALATAQGVEPDRLVLIPGSMDDARFGLDGKSYRSLASCVTTVIHCAAMVNLAVDRTHMEVWAQAGITNILQFCRDAEADLRFTSSSAVFPEVGGPHAEGPTSAFEICSGYGAAKIEAEHRIARSGVPAHIVRLPSLYDLSAPNTKDIYEIIMGACLKMNAIPQGMTFRMVEAQAAAAFLVGLPEPEGTQYFNFTPNVFATPDVMPKGMVTLSQDSWLREAPLTEAERALIAADQDVLRATALFDHGAAQTAWQQITGRAFSTTSDPAALLQQRLTPPATAA
ncbi:AMP-binding protein [Roseobacter weihaiensis]|uniref:AMP-binding protein n=1 Tax=Roseobacter weihaiensis TaxID=2763262 RepID=UPI001D0A9F19|nr:AMP-binding protein [Roseobacter sp. H9]